MWVVFSFMQTLKSIQMNFLRLDNRKNTFGLWRLLASCLMICYEFDLSAMHSEIKIKIYLLNFTISVCFFNNKTIYPSFYSQQMLWFIFMLRINLLIKFSLQILMINEQNIQIFSDEFLKHLIYRSPYCEWRYQRFF